MHRSEATPASSRILDQQAGAMKCGQIASDLGLTRVTALIGMKYRLCLPKIRSGPRVEVIPPNEPQRSMGLRTLLESGGPNSL